LPQLIKRLVEEKLPEINSVLGTSYKTYEEVVQAGDLQRILPLALGEKTVDILKEVFPGGIPLGIHGPLHKDGGKHSHPLFDVVNSGEHKFHRRLIIGYRRSLHRHPESIMPEGVPELMPHGHALIPPTYFGMHGHWDLVVAKLKKMIGRRR